MKPNCECMRVADGVFGPAGWAEASDCASRMLSWGGHLKSISEETGPKKGNCNGILVLFTALGYSKHTRMHARTHARTHAHKHTHTHTRARAHTHTHTRTHVGFYGLRGLSIGVMVFILYKLYVLLPYTYPTPKLSPHRRRCISTFPPKNSLCMIYKRFKLWGHWKCPHKSPSPCNTYVIPMSLYKFVSS